MSRLRNPLIVLVAALALVGLAACERAETPDDTAVVPEPGETNAAEAALAIDDVSIGGQLGDDGAIAFGHNNNEFAPGDPIYVAMEVGDAPAGMNVRLVWYGPDGMEVGQQAKTVSQGDHYMSFEAAPTGSWAAGEYRAEVWANDEMVNEIEFEIEGGDAGPGDDDAAEGEA